MFAALAFYWRTTPLERTRTASIGTISEEDRTFWAPYLTGDRPVLIFVGAPKLNRQLRYALPGGDFRFITGGIENTAPMPGEESQYRIRRSDDGLFPVEDYTLIW